MFKLLTPDQLQQSDILLKWITDDSGFLSKGIGIGQHPHLWMHMGHSAAYFRKNYGVDPTQFSHAALAMGPNEIMEFDEGSGIWDIMQFKGAGVVTDVKGNDPSRKGNKYLVVRCRDRELARRTWKKALTVKTCWQTEKRSSYGIRKLLNSALFHKRGETMNDKKIRKELAKMKGEQNSWWRTNRANFFCSHFVTFVYLWAAHDMVKFNQSLGTAGWVLGIDKARISPAELAARLISTGSSNFEIIGEFAP
ncbi:MAG: hypothetical protein MI867_01325 [Pseudomonadales bacterium]|nr:hypothetical protein [Pseudomonadales bacterium]